LKAKGPNFKGRPRVTAPPPGGGQKTWGADLVGVFLGSSVLSLFLQLLTLLVVRAKLAQNPPAPSAHPAGGQPQHAPQGLGSHALG